ncbi:Esterase SG1 [Orchesella cincta]|uniref:Esterase SG1 n=1 Tax=Orchesella cincta TaxID=48709 RepID=A0A1D2NCJ9_ORCCI|nr:Esterase SG1 [Orchesella cincta]
MIVGTYMLNLLCAIVPCQATMKPPEAHIANFADSNLQPKNSSVLESINILDPVLASNDIELQRTKRQNETTTDRYSTTSPRPATPQQPFPNLRNPFRTLINAVSKGVEAGSGFTHNFGNRLVPFPESNRVGDGGNAKRDVKDQNGIDAKETLVYLRNGDAIEGNYMGTMKGRRFMAFQGIPYAEPPVGALRFRPPVPKRSWGGVLKALRPGSVCLQGHPIGMFKE